MSAGADARRTGELVGGRYRIVRLLAAGGMGVVYEAQHAVVRRRFAIKFLRRELAERRDILGRFQREAEAAGALASENVMAAVDFGVSDDGTPYIVMEYLTGESLGVLLQRCGPLPVARAADLVAQACRGIAAAHAAGIVHRDLKPENLHVSRRDDGTDLIKVLDFGVAKLQAIDHADAATRTGTVLGTAAYMSPEQARGESVIDGRTDVYALGAILYELLSQRRPHPGDSQNAILHHIATQPAVPLGSARPDLPAPLVDVVGRALASDAAARPASAEQLAQALAPFARRQVWPAVPAEDSGARPGDVASTLPAQGEAGRAGAALDESNPPVSIDDSGPPAPESTTASRRRRWRAPLLLAGTLAVVAVMLAAGVARRGAGPSRAERGSRPARATAVIAPGTRFLAADPVPGAAAQIQALLQAKAFRDAALLNAMVATPTAFWFLGGSPQQVQSDVRDVTTRGARQGRVPVLVSYNHPFHDCLGYGISGASDAAAYRAWIDAFAAGIGNQRAIVILEPGSLGTVPYGATMDGTADGCKPTVADAQGRRARPVGATPEERYALLGDALDSLARRAPNTAVYLDGTHSRWLPVGDVAYRLRKAGVERAAGFFLNTGNYQPTPRVIQFGTWIAKCLRYAMLPATSGDATGRYRECASPAAWANTNDDRIWSKIDAWYVEHVDRSPELASSRGALTHFVINTSRNGRGPLVAAVYASPPYDQPPAVVEVLRSGSWCMPPGRGVGLRPTADTGVPLVDAYLWTDPPGISEASCDIAGGARAWDYSRYNPWQLSGDAQNHFDPLWGMVLPALGAWFPENALDLARNANPPLDGAAPAATAATEIAGAGPQPLPATASAGRPVGRPAGRPMGLPMGRPMGLPVGRPMGRLARAGGGDAVPLVGDAPAGAGANSHPEAHRALAPAFDSANPYR